MRVYEGQRSDKVAIKRSRDEKRILLARVREEYSMLRPTVAATLREAMARRIRELEAELGDDADLPIQPVGRPNAKP